jgi:cell wall-associated NlpC family hydrolase
MRSWAFDDVLDDGMEAALRVVGGFATAMLLVLFVMIVTPVVLIAMAFGGLANGISSSPPAASPAPPMAGSPSGPPAPTVASVSVVDIARRYLGVPYVFGGTNPAFGLDCSGLTQLVYRQAGLSLPRTAQEQYDATARVGSDQLQPGDLVFFARTYPDPHDWITHVGIYIGGGLQINAPTEGRVVSIEPVFSGFWAAHFASGGRVRIVN